MTKPILATLALTLVMSLCLAACGSTEASDMGEITGYGTGLVLGYPIVGATVEDYASRLDAYLSGEETEESVSLIPEEGATAAYVVTVVDQNGDPVPGVYVNFCTPRPATWPPPMKTASSILRAPLWPIMWMC